MAVPNIFGTATSAIPLSQLDTNFATPVTIGNTAVQLGNTVTSFGNVTLTNVTISSGNVTVTSPAIFPAGTATAPAITTTGDTNTGIFFPAADTIAFSEGGVEAARFDSAGNFGLGVTPSTNSANSSIEINKAGNGLSVFSNTDFRISRNVIDSGAKYARSGETALTHILGNGTFAWYNAPAGTAGNAISFTQAMTLDASGNLLVGTTSGSFSTFVKDLNGNAAFGVTNSGNSTPNGVNINFSAAAPNDASSNFLIAYDTVNTKARIYSNGGIANFSANNVNLSDRREKTNFAPAKSYLDVICAIPVQTFNYIDQNLEEDAGLTLGVVAQDVQAVAPELVMESDWAAKGKDPKIRLSIYQTDLQYALMKCIQEQQALITQLTARITALEGA
jgi:hypothetical protein